MLFNSFIFLFFLLCIIPTYYFLDKKYKNIFLLIVSYFFYAYWDYRFCSLLLISTLVDFFIGQKLHSISNIKRRKLLVLVSLFTNLGILGFFKYFNFFIDNFVELSKNLGVQLDFLHINILLPVGISFYTFQTLSYTIDIYRKKLAPTKSIVDFALFVTFFPQLVAGPIERASTLLPQIAKKNNPSIQQMKDGVILIIYGLFRKVILGDTSGRFADHIFTKPEHYSASELLMGLILFSVQIYCDFSGYSSIARGSAKLLGIELMRNFRQPYLSSSITEFWRRWHISLSEWLRDYLYIPLGGNRKGVPRMYINLMITMVIGGLWHGANVTFIIWGALHGMYLTIHKVMMRYGKPSGRYHYSNFTGFCIHSIKVVCIYLLVLFTWLFFRASSLKEAYYILHKICLWQGNEFLLRTLFISGSFLFFSTLLDFMEYYYRSKVYYKWIPNYFGLGILAAMFFITLAYMLRTPALPFVYFQF